MAWSNKRGRKWWMGYRRQDGRLVQKSLETTDKKSADAELERLRPIGQAHASTELAHNFVAALTGNSRSGSRLMER